MGSSTPLELSVDFLAYYELEAPSLLPGGVYFKGVAWAGTFCHGDLFWHSLRVGHLDMNPGPVMEMATYSLFHMNSLLIVWQLIGQLINSVNAMDTSHIIDDNPHSHIMYDVISVYMMSSDVIVSSVFI